jgi:hypothetical protein
MLRHSGPYGKIVMTVCIRLLLQIFLTDNLLVILKYIIRIPKSLKQTAITTIVTI